MIMHFLLVRLEAGRKEAAAAAMRATAAQARAAKSRAELMRGIRLAMMVRLWGWAPLVPVCVRAHRFVFRMAMMVLW